MAPPADVGAPAAIVVTVVRSGGFAGLTRTWTAQPGADDKDHWVALIDDCPWGAPTPCPPPSDADRFVWRIHAVCGPHDEEAILNETDLSGPWQVLVDEVRAFGAQA